MLNTPRLLLKIPIDSECLVLKKLWQNEQTRRFLGGTLEDHLIEEKLAALKKHWELHKFGQWIVYENISDQVIGLCGLHHSDDGIELSYMFFPEFWGKGYANEAAKAAIKHGFDTLKTSKIIAITQAENKKSINLLKKIGMRHACNFMRYGAEQSLYEITQ